MSNDDDGTPFFAHGVNGTYDCFFAEGIEMCGRLIEDDDLRVGSQSARESQALALTDGQSDTARPDRGVPSVGRGSKDGIKARRSRSRVEFWKGQPAHIIQDRSGHEGGGLGYPRDLLTPRGRGEVR